MIPRFNPQVLCGINPDFSGLSPTNGQIPTRYSPVRRSSASSKLDLLPLDLHVLGLPPAFNLSHDQTLQFKINAVLACRRSNRSEPNLAQGSNEFIH